MVVKNLLHATRLPRFLRESRITALRVQGRLREPRALPCDVARLRILARSPTYLPNHRRGAEVTLHVVLTELQARGHEVRVLADPGCEPGAIDDVEVLIRTGARADASLARWSDVIIAQLSARDAALRMAARYRRPVAYYVHVGNPPRHALFGEPELTLFSSRAVQASYPALRRSLVIHPPIREADYLTGPGTAITLVNLTDAKGAPLLYELARRMPARAFLGVKGWGPQLLPQAVARNLQLADPVVNMRRVYGRTMILLMPSVYESYGRVALEAAVSGIPTIAHPNRGIREAMGDATIYADREDVNAWVAAIEELDDKDTYKGWSSRARARFELVSSGTDAEIDHLERALRALTSP